MRGRLIASLVLLIAITACKREDRESRAQPEADESSVEVTVSGLRPGGASAKPPAGHERYTENSYQTGEGKRLFVWFNCSGCHANGGGGMGPPLMDDRWIYGSEPENIYATILEGRPNGMPSFRGMIPGQQIWQLVAYVRALGGLARTDVAPGRSDDMSIHPSEQRLPAQAPLPSSLPPASIGSG